MEPYVAAILRFGRSAQAYRAPRTVRDLAAEKFCGARPSEVAHRKDKQSRAQKQTVSSLFASAGPVRPGRAVVRLGGNVRFPAPAMPGGMRPGEIPCFGRDAASGRNRSSPSGHAAVVRLRVSSREAGEFRARRDQKRRFTPSEKVWASAV